MNSNVFTFIVLIEWLIHNIANVFGHIKYTYVITIRKDNCFKQNQYRINKYKLALADNVFFMVNEGCIS